MKELSIEEKAKRFDEALKTAKECITYIPDEAVNKYMLSIFPELKENEDEKIRKQILSFLKEFECDHYRNLNFSSWIAWLEKQQDNTNIEQVFRPLAGCCIDTAAKQAIEQQKIGKNVVLAFNGCYIPVKNNTVDAIVNKYNAWVEKQGKEVYALKSSKDEDVRKFMQQIKKEAKAYEIILPNRDYDIYAFAKDILAWLEKQGEQSDFNADFNVKDYNSIDPHFAKPIDKVEPKFKTGDWIIKNNNSSINTDYSICKITNVENGNYTIESIYGYKGYNTFETFEKDYHIFTIADAKDGDVVVDKSDGTIGIFQSIGHHPDGGSYNDTSYCCLHCRCDNEFFYADFENGNTIDSDDLIPATKEQRDTLERAIVNAGYKWNEKELKLEKI